MSPTTPNNSPVLLLAEDDADILSNLIEYFESLGFVVYGVRSGDLAYELASRIKPDLIITDLIMPGLSGIAFLQKLKSLPATDSLPVIILSARVEAELREQTAALGAVDFVTKPFRLDRLREAVNTALFAKETAAREPV